MKNHLAAAVLVAMLALCVSVAAWSAEDLKDAETSLIQVLQKLCQTKPDSRGLRADCRIIISEQSDEALRYLFTLSLDTGGRFRPGYGKDSTED